MYSGTDAARFDLLSGLSCVATSDQLRMWARFHRDLLWVWDQCVYTKQAFTSTTSLDRMHISFEFNHEEVNWVSFGRIRHSLLRAMKCALSALPAENPYMMNRPERFEYALNMYVRCVCYVAYSLMNSEVSQERDTPSKC